MPRIREINARLAEIETELSGINVNDANVSFTEVEQRIASLQNESNALVAERAQLLTERARQVAGAINNPGTPIPAPNPVNDRSADFARMSTRDKLASVLGRQARGRGFSEPETRALGVALTTTATAFQQATSSVNGVNNAGVFISTKLLLDLLKEEGKLSPIFHDIAFTHIPGLVEFPYRAMKSTAHAKAEGQAGVHSQMRWEKLSLNKGYLQTIVPVTDEILALTEWDLGNYLMDSILNDLEEDWITELIYATGTTGHVKGITFGATPAVVGGYDKTATGFRMIDTLISSIKKCTGKFRKGAKLYVAQDIYDEIAFAQDKNGNFLYPIFNNANGITSVGMLPLVVDENLVDGDYIIGNVGKYFKANTLIGLRLESQRDIVSAINTYAASEYCAAAPFPGAFVHGSAKAV